MPLIDASVHIGTSNHSPRSPEKEYQRQFKALSVVCLGDTQGVVTNMSAQNGSTYRPDQFMNPGPAPRPPTDRPRLALTPNTNLPGSMSNMTLNSPMARPGPPQYGSSTYTGSTISLPIARQTSSSTDGSGGLAVIKQGWATVKENRNFINPWKQRYLILRKEVLDFHKAEGSKVAYTIYLRDVTNVGRVESAGTIFEIKRRSDSSSNNPGDDDGSTKTLQIKVKGDDDLYEWIDFIYARCPGMGGVSNPTNFSHAVHVGFDPQTGEFVGLPPEWSKLLNSSAITKEDYERNPQAVFEVLDFYSDLTKRAENPQQYPSLTPTPPASSMQNKQLGYNTGGASVVPPRPVQQQRNPSSYSQSPQGSQAGAAPRKQSPTEQQRVQMQGTAPNYQGAERSREEQRAREEALARQRQMEMEEQNRRDLEAYNASIPKAKTPMAQQELGGYGGGSSVPAADRFNPSLQLRLHPRHNSSNLRAFALNDLLHHRPPVQTGTGLHPDNSNRARHPSLNSNSKPRHKHKHREPASSNNSKRLPTPRAIKMVRRVAPSRVPIHKRHRHNQPPGFLHLSSR